MADEYIRREDAVKRLDPYRRFEIIQDAIDYIESLEPADVAPAVRCENCVHWSDSNQCERPELAGNRWHDDKYFETLPDDFCSYGERREE